MSRVACGLDIFLSRPGRWRGRRLGLIIHQASVTRDLEPALQAFRRAPGFAVSALFAPEHGLAGALQDQVPVQGRRDERLGLPVFSLYGDERSPTAAMLEPVDALVFDLQDIGIRYYTFIWTMALVMQAAAKAGKPVIVLDRPNPLGGLTLEGNVLDPAYSSFVGLFPLPVRHGLTCGELAAYLNDRFQMGCDLHVVAMRGWQRRLWMDETGLPWVMPSPNMPTLDTAAVYGGMCLVEGTNLSEGRGTTRPFEIVGAPFIDADALADALNALRLPGVRFRPCLFQPTFHKWAGETCGGVQLHVTDRRRFKSYLTGLCLLQAVRRLWPDRFQWRPPPYEYETEKLPIDILCGTDALRRAMESEADLKRLEQGWSEGLKTFWKETKPYRLY